MSIKFKEMVAGQTLTAAAVSYYAAPTLTSATIQAATVYNPTGAPVTVLIYKVPSGGSANASTLISTRAIPAGASLTPIEAINHKLEPGTQIFATGLALTLNVSGIEYIPE